MRPGPRHPRRTKPRLDDLRRRFLDSEWADLQPLEVETEIDFTETSLDGSAHIVICKLDAVYRRADRGGRIEIVDWKTGAPPRDETERGQRMLQLELYRRAYHEKHAVPARPDRRRALLRRPRPRTPGLTAPRRSGGIGPAPQRRVSGALRIGLDVVGLEFREITHDRRGRVFGRDLARDERADVDGSGRRVVVAGPTGRRVGCSCASSTPIQSDSSSGS